MLLFSQVLKYQTSTTFTVRNWIFFSFKKNSAFIQALTQRFTSVSWLTLKKKTTKTQQTNQKNVYIQDFNTIRYIPGASLYCFRPIPAEIPENSEDLNYCRPHHTRQWCSAWCAVPGLWKGRRLQAVNACSCQQIRQRWAWSCQQVRPGSPSPTSQLPCPWWRELQETSLPGWAKANKGTTLTLSQRCFPRHLWRK